jgi:enamine deaminase RidA (YjgF/YER057c/UK114 family)
VSRINIASGGPWEPLRAFSRAVIVGETVYISGTTALTSSGEVVGEDNPYEQTRYVLERIRAVLQSQEFMLADVVRTRIFITDMTRYDEYARAHREFFDKIRPASSIVEVKRLVDRRLLVELEVDAVRGSGASAQTVLIKA